MIIHSKFKDYTVHIHDDLEFLSGLQETPNAEFVIDQNVYNLYRKEFAGIPEERLYLVEAVEDRKVIDSALAICEKMTEIPAKRNAHLISVGGGIVQDITGFAANILYRGVPWVFVPTTLLASCDSCIGGKSSLNYKKFKNLLGTFYPPDELHISPVFFQTLSQRDFESGLGEVIKFNILAGETGLSSIERDIEALLTREKSCLNHYIESSLIFKKSFIEKDEFDRGERIKLNFAHTFGHAFEAASGYKIPHGIAVSMGMITANHISVMRGLLSLKLAARMETLLRRVINLDLDDRELEQDAILSAIHKDKKQVSDQISAVLLGEQFDLTIVHDVRAEEVHEAVSYLIGFLCGRCGEKKYS